METRVNLIKTLRSKPCAQALPGSGILHQAHEKMAILPDAIAIFALLFRLFHGQAWLIFRLHGRSGEEAKGGGGGGTARGSPQAGQRTEVLPDRQGGGRGEGCNGGHLGDLLIWSVIHVDKECPPS